MVFLAVLRDPARLHRRFPLDSGKAVGRACDVRRDPSALLPAVAGQVAGAFGKLSSAVQAVLLASRHRRPDPGLRSEEHTSELQSLMRISYAVFCLKKKTI